MLGGCHIAWGREGRLGYLVVCEGGDVVLVFDMPEIKRKKRLKNKKYFSYNRNRKSRVENFASKVRREALDKIYD